MPPPPPHNSNININNNTAQQQQQQRQWQRHQNQHEVCVTVNTALRRESSKKAPVQCRNLFTYLVQCIVYLCRVDVAAAVAVKHLV